MFKKIGFAFALLLGTAQAKPFDYAQLKALIQNRQLHSVASVLSEMPADLRARYELIRQSRSLQSGTPDLPRMIFFEDDASFIMGVSGYSAEENLEIIQFNQKKLAFDFIEVEFDQSNIHKKPIFRDGISSPKPAVCVECHTHSLRPNWEPYNLWPDVYGGYDDGIRVHSPEGKLFSGFIENGAKKGRYQYLQGLPKELGVGEPRFGDGENYWSISSDKSHYRLYETMDRIPYEEEETFARPALKFVLELERLNALRTGNLLWTHPKFSQMMETVSLLARGCSNKIIENSLPEDLRPLLLVSQEALKKKIAPLHEAYYKTRLRQVAKVYLNPEEIQNKDAYEYAVEVKEKSQAFGRALRFSFYAEPIWKMQYFFQPLNFNVLELSLSKIPNAYSYLPIGDATPFTALDYLAKTSYAGTALAKKWIQLQKETCP